MLRFLGAETFNSVCIVPPFMSEAVTFFSTSQNPKTRFWTFSVPVKIQQQLFPHWSKYNNKVQDWLPDKFSFVQQLVVTHTTLNTKTHAPHNTNICAHRHRYHTHHTTLIANTLHHTTPHHTTPTHINPQTITQTTHTQNADTHTDQNRHDT